MSTRTLILPIGGGGLDPTDYYNKQEVDQLLSTKEDSADLATVAESGSYNDLTDKPNYGASLSLTIDSSTFVMTAQLLDQNGNNLGSAQTVDLPLESVVVSGRYDDQTKKVILTLQNGSTIEFSIADLVSGLQTEITAQNPLSADLLADGNTNKVFTATEQSKLSGIESGAEVNVQADWNQSDNSADDYIKNKPTIPDAQVQSDWNQDNSSAVDYIKNKPVIPAVNDATVTIRQTGQADQTFTLNQSSNATIDIAAGGGGSDWYGTQAQFDALGTYDTTGNTQYHISDKIDWNSDIKNRPSIPYKVSQLPNDAGYINSVKTINGIPVKGAGNIDIMGIIGKYEWWGTQTEYNTLVQNNAIDPNVRYHIEGEQETMAITFTLQGGTTVTYDVYIKPSI